LWRRAVSAYSYNTWTVFESDKSKVTVNSRPANCWLNFCKSSAFSGDLVPAITVVFGRSSIYRGAHTHCVEVLLSVLYQTANRADKVLAYLIHKLEPNASIRAGNNPHCACHLAESCEVTRWVSKCLGRLRRWDQQLGCLCCSVEVSTWSTQFDAHAVRSSRRMSTGVCLADEDLHVSSYLSRAR